MPESFMRNEEIRKKLIKIAKGEGGIPLFVAADMNRESQILLLHWGVDYEKMMAIL